MESEKRILYDADMDGRREKKKYFFIDVVEMKVLHGVSLLLLFR
jgi:hypothetical protein